jgi:exopolysaccharide production protein ExoY
MMERLAAGLLLLLVSPVLVTAGITIMILSRRSPLVAHHRVGYGGRHIWVLKLRTMWPSRRHRLRFRPFVERLSPCRVCVIKPRFDPRVSSRFAAFCRKYSIDELPQLWNVIAGDMALLGPRPLTADELAEHYAAHSRYVLSVKPGITGLWQVKGRSRLTYKQRKRLDLFLLKHWSLGLYGKILAATVSNVLTGRDAW